jgi:XTP/dITP diphosphohydrolase
VADGDEEVLAFLDVMRRLRAECPWKAAQTHRSLARYLLEETHETVEALDSGDAVLLREELGDLLLQVFLHTAIAEEAGDFTTADVARDAIAKMVRRNPHVFGDDHGDLDPAEVNELWESRKAQEKQRSSVTEGLAPGLPALLYADKVLDRAQRAGTPLEVPAEPTDLGDRLLALVAEARAEGTDPEQALRDAVRRLL